MVSIVCVLKSGGIYTVQDVKNLFESVNHHAKDFRFFCFTDFPYSKFPKNINVVELIDGWPGWWSKIELFRRGVFIPFSRVWYFDLDTIIVDDLEPLLKERSSTTFLSDFYWPERIATGAMCWIGGENHAVYTQFKMGAERYIAQFRKGGDQAFIQYVVGAKQQRFQERFPGAFVSYKVHCTEGTPEDARVVCFHGRPKPNEINKNHLIKEKHNGRTNR